MIEFLQSNWFWIFIVLFIGMHLFGGGCGMSGHRRAKDGPTDETKAGREKGCH